MQRASRIYNPGDANFTCRWLIVPGQISPQVSFSVPVEDHPDVSHVSVNGVVVCINVWYSMVISP